MLQFDKAIQLAKQTEQRSRPLSYGLVCTTESAERTRPDSSPKGHVAKIKWSSSLDKFPTKSADKMSGCGGFPRVAG